MAIEYREVDGRLYAYISKSVRHGTKVTKERQTLGRVVDKEKGIFMNRERGIFTYDPKTNTYGEAPDDAVIPERRKRNTKEYQLLDFGDAFMVSRFLKSTGLTPVIEEIECQNPNTLWALIYFYTLTQSNISCCQSWYEGSYTSILYPNANLTSQNINSLLEEIGTENSYQKFFGSYLKWFKENEGNTETTQNDANVNKEDADKDKEKDKDANEEKDKSEGGNKHESIKPTIQFLFAIQKEIGTPVYLEILPFLKADDANQTSETNRIKETAADAAAKELEGYGIPADSCSFYFHQQSYPAVRTERFCIPDRINNTSTASLLYGNPDLQNQDHNQYQDQIRSSLLLSFIADVIRTLLTKKLRKLEKPKQADISFEETCILARNLKCKVFENYTVPNKSQPKLSEIFETLGIKVPAKIMLGTRKLDAGPDKNSKEPAQLLEGQ